MQTLHHTPGATPVRSLTIPTASLTQSGLRFRRYDVPQMPCMKCMAFAHHKQFHHQFNLPTSAPKKTRPLPSHLQPSFTNHIIILQTYPLNSVSASKQKCPSASSPPAQRQQHSAPPHPPAYSQQHRHSRSQQRRRQKKRLRRRTRQPVRRAWLLLRRAVRHCPSPLPSLLPIPHSHCLFHPTSPSLPPSFPPSLFNHYPHPHRSPTTTTTRD